MSAAVVDVAAAVRAARRSAGMNQTDLADALGWPQPRVSRRETGEVEYTSSELKAIAVVLNVPVASFFGEGLA